MRTTRSADISVASRPAAMVSMLLTQALLLALNTGSEAACERDSRRARLGLD